MPLNSPIPDPPDSAGWGCLYVVATPIGNLEDITLRALNVLAGVDLIAAEDTRRTAKLLARHSIRTSLIACHEHNEQTLAPVLVGRIQDGRSVALVSDAGTPSVSDPGYRLVTAAVEAGLTVVPIPGVSAAMAALSVSGLPTDRFVFAGFPDRRKGKRRGQIVSLAAEEKTLIFYESPRRVIGLLDELAQVLGDRQAVLGREMTKRHEEFIRGALTWIARTLRERAEVKGECTLLVAGARPVQGVAPADLETEIRTALEQPGGSPSAVSKPIARRHGIPKREVYAMALAIQEGRWDRK